MKWLTLFTAIILAGCAAWFSIIGLMTIFAGAAFSIMVMAGVLEFAKLVSAAWLHYEWERINILTRTYFTFAVVILMFITSMGIFGYLSKAHIEQSVKIGGSNELQIDNIERQIKRQQGIVTDAETVLTQLDQQVSVLIEYDRIRGPTGSIAVRESQSEERSLLNQTIDAAYTRIEELQTDLAPLRQEKLELEVEIGPLKYIAELVYGEEAESYFDTAVRWIIILLVVVFDPLAIMLLIVSTGAFKRDRIKMKPLINEEQIMRMDLDGTDNTDSTNTSSTGGNAEQHTAGREGHSQERDTDQSISEDAIRESIYVRQQWDIDYDRNPDAQITQSPDLEDWDHAPSRPTTDYPNISNKGLTTVMKRRPV